MGLASALNTALTGLTAAETIIDVVGNNLANAGTVGFKASDVNFATQLLQTRGLGSGPTDTSGGTNPRQVGLGVQVAEITPDFTQGTVEVSSNPSDIAIQGDGFFVVQAASGEELYTRNGIFKTNSSNELVTIGGQRVLGYGVDENFNVDTTEVQPLTIPLGSEAIAEATKNAFFQGTLTPTGDVADTAEIIKSAILGDGQYIAPSYPPTPASVTPDILVATPPSVAGSGGGPNAGVGTELAAGVYNYKVVFYDANNNETLASAPFPVTLGAAAHGIDLTGLPTDATGDYVGRRIYRTVADAANTSTYYRVADDLIGAANATRTDLSTNVTTDSLSTTDLTGQYQYYITYYNAGASRESRPSELVGPLSVVNGRIRLDNIPGPPTAPGNPFENATIRIYRNTASQSSVFYRVDEIDAADVGSGKVYIDDTTDATLTTGNQLLDFNGPKILTNTNLVDIVKREGSTYTHLFGDGTLTFQPRKGGRQVGSDDARVFHIHDGTDPDHPTPSTVQDLLNFFQQSFGIVQNDGSNGIPVDAGSLSGPGAAINLGRIQLIANNGTDNAIDIEGVDITYTASGASTVASGNKDLGFFSTQSAKGQSAVTNFNAYDSLGEKINVRVTAVLESRTSEATTYRWFADSADNAIPDNLLDDIPGNVNTNVGTGLITFDGKGNVILSSTNSTTVTINRAGSNSAITPLVFNLDFSKMSGLSTSKSSLTAFEQDGSARGELTSYIISESGLISGVFSNGKSRDLGQVLLARFNNPSGLVQKGSNLFAAGVNSGLPIVGAPGEQGIGSIISGATELSNTDVGKNLIDLILASSQYRGNTRVITTAQQLLDELLNLRR